MLLIEAKAGVSKIHGMGLIAENQILAGTIIWRFQPGFDVKIPESELENLSIPARKQVIYYAYFHEESRTFVLSSDDDRFTNHSDDPNTKSIDDYVIAIKDIEAGEEITCDYRELVMLNFK